MPRLPDHWTSYDAADIRHPFRLVTAPARQFLNTSFTETPTSRKREGRPTALLHPDDAARLGVTAGDRLRLGNARGEIVLLASIGTGQQPGTIIVESVWPNTAFEGGVGINALTSEDPAYPNGGAVFHDTAIWARAEAAIMAVAAE
jgi:anaerobic selenocysteine-containing dehydrogenase